MSRPKLASAPKAGLAMYPPSGTITFQSVIRLAFLDKWLDQLKNDEIINRVKKLERVCESSSITRFYHRGVNRAGSEVVYLGSGSSPGGVKKAA